jgi:hypothetical protein
VTQVTFFVCFLANVKNFLYLCAANDASKEKCNEYVIFNDSVTGELEEMFMLTVAVVTGIGLMITVIAMIVLVTFLAIVGHNWDYVK